MGCVVNATTRPLYPQEGYPAPIVQEAGWAPGPFWTGAKNLAFPTPPPAGFDSRAVEPVASRYTDYAVPAHTNRNSPKFVFILFLFNFFSVHCLPISARNENML
jgi:hypothetical protein